jgi:hypothetical protein
VTGWLDEIDACVDAVVYNVHAVDLILGIEVCVEALLNVLHNGAPRSIVVDKVAEPRGINDSQAQTHAVLFNVSAD